MKSSPLFKESRIPKMADIRSLQLGSLVYQYTNGQYVHSAQGIQDSSASLTS